MFGMIQVSRGPPVVLARFSYELRSLRGGQKSRDQRQPVSRDLLADMPDNRMLQMRVCSLVDALQASCSRLSCGKRPH